MFKPLINKTKSGRDMNAICQFRKCTLTDEELVKEVDRLTDQMYETGKIPSRNIPAKPNKDFDLLIGELLLRFNVSWKSIDEDPPKAQQRVYVICEKPKYGGGVFRYQTMAEYIPYMAVKEEDYMAEEYWGEGDYDEEKDQYYVSEGYYEWQSEAEMNWKISAKVTHWMPLIELP